ncbi:hypothetical protein [Chitinophaga sp.]|uniref:hypothetical protein n=1 Tax=Chitinophaga sp. TaxID=1869181 RepID=UPI0031D365DC
MKELKYFTKNGSQYIMKGQHGFSLVVIILLAAAAVGGVYAHLPGLTWICGILTILFIAAIFLKRVVIDLDQQAFFLKSGLLSAATTIPFADFVSFELASVRHSFIITNTSLNICFTKNGKEKTLTIAQGFTIRAMQNVLNEIEEIWTSGKDIK